MWVRDRLEGLWSDEDFVGWYPRDGRPAWSPAQLATVCVLQFLDNLSDRQAAEAVRCRIDYKYALGLELEDPGFHHSVLSDFRDRLAEDDRADRLLDLMLTRLKESGLVKARGRQRTDSTRVLSAGRELTRLELVTEAVRVVLEHLATAAPQILDDLVTAEWSQRYGRQVRMCSQSSPPVARLAQVGADADVLLERVYGRFGEQVPPQADVLRRLLIQHFLTDARGKFRPRTERDGLPPSRIRIQSPYETPGPLGAPRRHPLDRLPPARHRDLRRGPGQRRHRRGHLGVRGRQPGSARHPRPPQEASPAAGASTWSTAATPPTPAWRTQTGTTRSR